MFAKANYIIKYGIKYAILIVCRTCDTNYMGKNIKFKNILKFTLMHPLSTAF